MTENEANSCVKYLLNLFPAMPRDQEGDRIRAVRKTFLPLRAAEVRRAIETRVGLEVCPDLSAIVSQCTPPPVRPNPLIGGTYRVHGMTPEQLKAQQATGRKIKADRLRASRLVSRLQPEVAARLREKALELMGPELRSIYQRRPTLESPPLLHAVAQLALAGR